MTAALPAFALVAVLVGGCGAPHLQTMRRAEASLTGASADRLVQCIGAPAQIEGDTGRALHRYSSVQPRDANGLTLPDPPAAEAPRACLMNAVVAGGRIDAVRFDNRAGWGFGSIARCSALVAACVEG